MRALADLPFEAVEPLELLGLTEGSAASEREHTRFGWCRLPGVELRGEDQAIWVDAPLVLGLHCPDEDAIAVPRRGGVPSDINLEFVLGDDDSAIALLSEFMRARAPALVGEARAIVLALCNPRRARISRPPELAGRRIYYGVGDVVAWLLRRPGATGWSLTGEAFVQLACDHWYSC